jgi:hypothetical protein
VILTEAQKRLKNIVSRGGNQERAAVSDKFETINEHNGRDDAEEDEANGKDNGDEPDENSDGIAMSKDVTRNVKLLQRMVKSKFAYKADFGPSALKRQEEAVKYFRNREAAAPRMLEVLTEHAKPSCPATHPRELYLGLCDEALAEALEHLVLRDEALAEASEQETDGRVMEEV